ncbi:MAG: DUF1853 family protein [Halioglobus sp.]
MKPTGSADMPELDINLENRYVRDLAWACFSPAIVHSRKLADDNHNVENCGLSLNDDRRRWLLQLDSEPQNLLAHLSNKPHTRLGLYFEHLWHFFLSEDPQVDFTAHNLAVRDQGRTLGEFDCLYFCRKRQRHFHLELAVKYFLSHSPGTGDDPSHWHDWLGPNCKDRLDLKIDHMMQRQIRLSEQPVAKEILAGLGIGELATEVEMKGWLFTQDSNPLPAPHAHNNERRLAKWIKIGDWETCLDAHDWSDIALLPRLQWLAPALRKDVDLMAPEAQRKYLMQHFQSSERPLLLAGFGGGDIEQGRFFVTPDNWPIISLA